ncbi:hypothetical protein CLV78_101121 [Aliiruegeria haliotis]|uniref:Uncharacterized protein n=1 Tax=Aliiruegeria haliotis TaxID=1280846 RepID=A0A2T0RXY6_9RHOB|nr:hypothetical protein [Aliiruegeria haliotis]PRY26028.1 hypothetical protein CLV78_101121 [Aliiruegeria haliotis]
MGMIRHIAVLAALACTGLMAGGAAAQVQKLDCYERLYSAEHLAKHAAQSVRRLTVALVEEAGDHDWSRWMGLTVDFAAQGQGGRNVRPGVEYEQTLRCFTVEDPHGWPGWVKPGTVVCAVDGDGGAIGIISRDKDSLLLWTRGVVLGEPDPTSGAPVPILTDEGAGSVRFKLGRVPAGACTRTW